MKIKDYKCKCGHNDFFFADKGNQKGIYCSYCGKWFKWGDKDEQNLATKQESVIDKITELVAPLRHLSIDQMSDIEWQILRVIDTYKAETEDK